MEKVHFFEQQELHKRGKTAGHKFLCPRFLQVSFFCVGDNV